MLLWELIFNKENFGLLVCEFDREKSEFVRMGKSCKKLLGYEPSEMVGKKFYEFIHEDDVQRTFDVVADQLMHGAEAIGFINRYKKKDGTYVLATWYSSGGDENRQIAFAEVREMTEVCSICSDPVIKKIRFELDSSLKRERDK